MAEAQGRPRWLRIVTVGRDDPGAARPRGRRQLSVFRLLLAVAVLAIGVHLVTDQIRSTARDHRQRCLQLADWHSRSASEYRRNARGSATMVRIAAWHDHMSAEFGRAASAPRSPIPASQPFPPADWRQP